MAVQDHTPIVKAETKPDEVGPRLDAVAQLLGRRGELGDRFVLEHALMMLAAAWAVAP